MKAAQTGHSGVLWLSSLLLMMQVKKHFVHQDPVLSLECLEGVQASTLIPGTCQYLCNQSGSEHPVHWLLSDLLPPACQVQMSIFLTSSGPTKTNELLSLSAVASSMNKWPCVSSPWHPHLDIIKIHWFRKKHFFFRDLPCNIKLCLQNIWFQAGAWPAVFVNCAIIFTRISCPWTCWIMCVGVVF